MDHTNLISKHCVPCEGTEDPFTDEQLKNYMPALSLPWETLDRNKNGTGPKKISHQFKFKNFPEAITFVDKIVPVAEGEGHHPDISIFYNKVTIELWTHAIGGLSENDFIIAARIESLA